MVLILGTGRTGTNIILSALSQSQELFCKNEIKDLFINIKTYPNNTLAKCDTCYIKNLDSVKEFIHNNPIITIIYTIRDFRDICLSKIYRGQTIQNGGDNKKLAEDATVEGCLKDIAHSFEVYKYLQNKNYPFLCIRMEDMILKTEETLNFICANLGILINPKMMEFYKYMNNEHKRKRYNKIDTSQVKIWERTDLIYNGYFKDKLNDVEKLFDGVKKYNEFFHYV